MILTYSAGNKTVQVSDRRLTVENGKLYDDEANKAVIVSCRNARFLIGYTGIARIGRKGTDLWLADELGNMGASSKTDDVIFENLRTKLVRDFGNRNPLTFVFAGYHYGPPRSGSFTKWLSNRGSEHMQCLHDDKKQVLYAHGMYPAISREARRRIKRYFNKDYFFQSTREKVAEELVAIIRDAAGHSTYGKYIGRGCMSAGLFFDKKGYVTNYHTDCLDVVAYMPYMVAGGMVMGGGSEPILRPATEAEIANMTPPNNVS